MKATFDQDENIPNYPPPNSPPKPIVDSDDRIIIELMLQERQNRCQHNNMLATSCRIMMFLLVLLLLTNKAMFSFGKNNLYALLIVSAIAFIICSVWGVSSRSSEYVVKNIDEEIFRLLERGREVEDAYIRSLRQKIIHRGKTFLENVSSTYQRILSHESWAWFMIVIATCLMRFITHHLSFGGSFDGGGGSGGASF